MSKNFVNNVILILIKVLSAVQVFVQFFAEGEEVVVKVVVVCLSISTCADVCVPPRGVWGHVPTGKFCF